MTGQGAAARFTLYSRSWCHLCEEMLAALQALAPPQRPFDVAVIDIDAAAAADPALLARFDELVPVLYGAAPGEPGPGRQLCHYFLDREAVASYLADFYG